MTGVILIESLRVARIKIILFLSQILFWSFIVQ
jgi:hypothetical protein